VVQPQRSDSGHNRLWDDVGRVVQPADADFENRRLYAEGEEGVEGEKREEAEVNGEDGRVLGECLFSQRYRTLSITCGFASSRSHTSKKYLANRSSEIGSPFIRIRSRTAHRCGDVYRPVY
jgi:hypothetical protein